MTKEDIFENLKDLILVLRDQEKVNSAVFRANWIKSNKKLKKELDSLDKADYDWFSKEYGRWASENWQLLMNIEKVGNAEANSTSKIDGP